MESILIAEDEPHIARLLKLALEKEGYKTTTVHNGVQALDEINRCPPDLLITDIAMPRMDGKELCKNLTDHYPERKFPVFVLSSRTEIEHRKWSREMTNTIFLEKPVSVRKLIKLIKENET